MDRMSFFSIGLLVFFCGTFSQAEEIVCPERIVTKEELVAVPPGWSPILWDMPVQLQNVEFYEGDPAHRVALVPDEEIEPGKDIAIWTFGSENKESITVACDYDRTNYSIWKRLPAAVTSCTVKYDPEIRIAGFPIIKRIECR